MSVTPPSVECSITRTSGCASVVAHHAHACVRTLDDLLNVVADQYFFPITRLCASWLHTEYGRFNIGQLSVGISIGFPCLIGQRSVVSRAWGPNDHLNAFCKLRSRATSLNPKIIEPTYLKDALVAPPIF